MAARLNEIVVDSHDPERLAAFWIGVLGWEVVDRDEGSVVIAGSSRGPLILFEPGADDKVVKNRLHLDVNPTDRDRDAEVARIVELGASPVDIGQRDVDWVVLADPEGNEFCVLAERADPD
jgi:catechol-2,3-dioxygenase